MTAAPNAVGGSSHVLCLPCSADIWLGTSDVASGTCLVHRKTECWVTTMIKKRGTKEPAAFTLTLVSWPLVTSKEHCITIWVRRYGYKVDSIICQRHNCTCHSTRNAINKMLPSGRKWTGQYNLTTVTISLQPNYYTSCQLKSLFRRRPQWLDIDIDIDLRC